MKKLVFLLILLALFVTFVACTDPQTPQETTHATETTDTPPTGTNDDTTVEKHNHTFSTEWERDENNHWHACLDGACDEMSELATHEYDEGNVTKPATEQETGIKVYTCTVCGYEKNETIEKLPHTHTPGEAVEENRVENTCTENGRYALVVYCSTCSAEISREGVVLTATGHIFDDENDEECNVCGEMRLPSYLKYANEFSATSNQITVKAEGIFLDAFNSLGNDLPLAGKNIPAVALVQPLTGNWQADVKISGSVLFDGNGNYASYGINLMAGDKNMKLVVQDRMGQGCDGQCVQLFGSDIGETNVNWPNVQTTWLRFVKEGNQLKAYASADGGTYSLIGETTVGAEFDSVELQIFATQLNRSESYTATVHSIHVGEAESDETETNEPETNEPETNEPETDDLDNLGDLKYANDYSATTDKITVTDDGIVLNNDGSIGNDLPLAGKNIPALAWKDQLIGNWQVDVKLSSTVVFDGNGGYASYGINILAANNNDMKLVVQDRNGQGCTGQCIQFVGTGIGETNVNWPEASTTWLRFVKEGNQLKAYASADGGTYSLIGETTVGAEFDSVELQIFATQLNRGEPYMVTVYSVAVSGN